MIKSFAIAILMMVALCTVANARMLGGDRDYDGDKSYSKTSASKTHKPAKAHTEKHFDKAEKYSKKSK